MSCTHIVQRDSLPSHVIVTNPLLSTITLPSSSRLNQPFIFVHGMTPPDECPTARVARANAFRRSYVFPPQSRPNRPKSLSSRRDAGSYFRALLRCTFCTSDISAAESVRRCSGCKYMYVRSQSLGRVDGNVRVPYDEETAPAREREVRSERREVRLILPPSLSTRRVNGGAIAVTNCRPCIRPWQFYED